MRYIVALQNWLVQPMKLPRAKPFQGYNHIRDAEVLDIVSINPDLSLRPGYQPGSNLAMFMVEFRSTIMDRYAQAVIDRIRNGDIWFMAARRRYKHMLVSQESLRNWRAKVVPISRLLTDGNGWWPLCVGHDEYYQDEKTHGAFHPNMSICLSRLPDIRYKALCGKAPYTIGILDKRIIKQAIRAYIEGLL